MTEKKQVCQSFTQVIVELLNPKPNPSQKIEKVSAILKELLHSKKFELLKRIVHLHPRLAQELTLQKAGGQQNESLVKQKTELHQNTIPEELLSFFLSEVFSVRRPSHSETKVLGDCARMSHQTSPYSSKTMEQLEILLECCSLGEKNKQQLEKPFKNQSYNTMDPKQTSADHHTSQWNEVNKLLSVWKQKIGAELIEEQIQSLSVSLARETLKSAENDEKSREAERLLLEFFLHFCDKESANLSLENQIALFQICTAPYSQNMSSSEFIPTEQLSQLSQELSNISSFQQNPSLLKSRLERAYEFEQQSPEINRLELSVVSVQLICEFTKVSEIHTFLSRFFQCEESSQQQILLQNYIHHSKELFVSLKQHLTELKSNFYLGRRNKVSTVCLMQAFMFWLLGQSYHQVLEECEAQPLKQKLIRYSKLSLLRVLTTTSKARLQKQLYQIEVLWEEIEQYFSKTDNLFSEEQLEKLGVSHLLSCFSNCGTFKKLFTPSSFNHQNKKVVIASSESKHLFSDQKYQRLIRGACSVIEKYRSQEESEKSLDSELLQFLLESQEGLHKFEFYSQTFHQKHLTLNYIYNSPEQIDMYQNQHHSHLFLELFSVLLENNYRCKQTEPFDQETKDKHSLNHKKCHSNLQYTFETLRNLLGRYLKEHLIQPCSKDFYRYTTIFKCCYLAFTDELFEHIDLNDLCLLFQLLLETIQRDNHPLIRQYIDVLMGRLYLYIGRVRPEQQYHFRNTMIGMLDLNMRDLNVSVPIVLILGYDLLKSVSEEQSLSKSPIERPLIHHSEDLIDEYGSKQIKPQHQSDIHYILVKYISCHVAYLRAICQYYLSQYLAATQQKDPFLLNLYHFWSNDKDSGKIMANISVAVEGFKSELEKKRDCSQSSSTEIQDFYLTFERVEEYPTTLTKYFLAKDTEVFLSALANEISATWDFNLTSIIKTKIQTLQRQCKTYLTRYLEEKAKQTRENKVSNSMNQDKKVSSKKKPKRKSQSGKGKLQSIPEQPTEIQKQFSKQQIDNKNSLLNQIGEITRTYGQFQRCQRPSVIIIASLLQKVHNFGYLMRTLTDQNAMLVVPSKNPLLHPECRQLVPEGMNVQVVQIKPKDLESFIQMQRSRGYPLIALEQCSKSVELEKVEFPREYMLLLGNERIGASGELLGLAEILVEIPQVGKIRSLNVHVSMVICFWEYLKQKNNYRKKEPQTKIN